ncbi:site-2 protease family protein [Nocardiopsis suaedae]|uniref:Zinc metalloprotease n=1 Tax=Nocardiopsis suaedae TaxID=3018444 RepID=A0ABT4TVM4_9ACTN|nr:site-2 protease family protein [Nocardiopsis suaedae]MDA2808751.1 site-2 protease family protein [Nocardiopsis suaedae]
MTDNGSSTRPAARGGTGRGSGLLMGRPFGIPIYVTPSWLIIAAIITIVYEPVVERTLALGPLSYLVAFAFAVLLYASVLVHELAHAVVARMFGVPVHRITLFMLGGVTEMRDEARTPGREFWISFAGPLLSLALAALGFAALPFVPPDTVAGVLVWQLFVANLLVGVFNLLPGLPLDGGKVVRAAVWKLTRRPTAGTVVAAWGGRFLAVLVMLAPLLIALRTGEAPSVFMVLLGVLLGAFMWTGAGSALRNARIRERIPKLRARTLARRAVPVSGDTPLSEARRLMGEADAGAVLVTDASGAPVSIVDPGAEERVPEERLPWTPVSQVAVAVTAGSVLDADLDGERLLEAMRRTPAPVYLLVREDGGVYGVLRSRDVGDAFAGT